MVPGAPCVLGIAGGRRPDHDFSADDGETAGGGILSASESGFAGLSKGGVREKIW